MRYVTADVAGNPAAHDNPLILRQVFRLVVATALSTFPNTTLRDDHRPGVAAPSVVRLAVEFIQANARPVRRRVPGPLRHVARRDPPILSRMAP